MIPKNKKECLLGSNRKALLRMDTYSKAQREMNLTSIWNPNLIHFMLFYFIFEAMKRYSSSNYMNGARQLL